MTPAEKWVGASYDRSMYVGRIFKRGWMVRLSEWKGPDKLGFGNTLDEAKADALRKVQQCS